MAVSWSIDRGTSGAFPRFGSPSEKLSDAEVTIYLVCFLTLSVDGYDRGTPPHLQFRQRRIGKENGVVFRLRYLRIDRPSNPLTDNNLRGNNWILVHVWHTCSRSVEKDRVQLKEIIPILVVRVEVMDDCSGRCYALSET